MSSLSLLVSAPFHQNDRPASCFHAILETLLADSLRAAKGACLRARDPLLGRCHAVRQGEQGHAEHGGDDDCNNNTCHDFGLHKARPKSYGEISTRARVPGERAVLIQSFLFPPRREGGKIRRLSGLRFVSAFKSINRRIPFRQKCHRKSFSNFDLLPKTRKSPYSAASRSARIVVTLLHTRAPDLPRPGLLSWPARRCHMHVMARRARRTARERALSPANHI
jgi:hypothetical protein